MPHSHRYGAEATIVLHACSSFKSDIPQCDNNFNSLGWIYGKTDTGQAFCDPLSFNQKDSIFSKTEWQFYALDPSGEPVKEKEMNVFSEPLLKNPGTVGDLHGMVIEGKNAQNSHYGFEIKMFCEPSSSTMRSKSALYDINQNKYLIEFYHKDACAYSSFSFFSNVGWLKYVYGPLIMGAGGFMLVTGLKFYKTNLALIGICLGGGLSYLLLCLYDPEDHPRWWLYFNIGVCVVSAAVFGFLIVAYKLVSLVKS